MEGGKILKCNSEYDSNSPLMGLAITRTLYGGLILIQDPLITLHTNAHLHFGFFDLYNFLTWEVYDNLINNFART